MVEYQELLELKLTSALLPLQIHLMQTLVASQRPQHRFYPHTSFKEYYIDLGLTWL